MKGGVRRPVLFRIILLLLLASILCAAGLGAFFAIQQVALAWPGSGLIGPTLQAGAPDSPPVNAEGTPVPQDQPLDAGLADLAAQLTPWDGAGRVTVLLLGLDYRDWEAQEEASRSDTMILLTLDPQSKTAGI